MRPRNSARRKGFSLIELLLGLTIFSTAFIMILAVFPTSVKAMHQGRQVLLATHIAQGQMETFLNGKTFATLADGSYTPTTPSMISMVNGQTEVMSFTTQIVVSTVSANLKDVRCQVTWQESIPGQITSMVRYVNLETMVANI
jgi:prepilin-type N-terminal cleavage/methylation domain-containing protein